MHSHNPGVGVGWGGNPGFHNHIHGYEDWGRKSYPCLRKTGQNNTMTITNLEAILHEIVQIWPKSCYLVLKKPVKLDRNVQNLLKQTIGYEASDKITRLAT